MWKTRVEPPQQASSILVDRTPNVSRGADHFGEWHSRRHQVAFPTMTAGLETMGGASTKVEKRCRGRRRGYRTKWSGPVEAAE